jgi:hypothetical protein
MNKNEFIERIIAHARHYHKGQFFILGVNDGKFQGAYADPNSMRGRAAPIFETFDELLQRMTTAPCTCHSNTCNDGEPLQTRWDR